jgi:hypothetical protein
MIDRDEDGYPTEAFYAEADPCESCGEPTYRGRVCRVHHEEFDACPWKFAWKHHLDIPALIEMFQHFYQEKLKGRAA